jgi:hypothetical protein
MIRKTVFPIFFFLMIALPLAAKTNTLRLGYTDLCPVHAFLLSGLFYAYAYRYAGIPKNS